MNEKNITRITVENYDYKTSWEVPYSDLNLDEIFNGFISCLVGVTYHQDQVLRAMKEYVEERLPDPNEEYDE